MTRQELHTKVDYFLDVAEREKMYGTVEFELREGRVWLLRTIKTEKFEDIGNTSHAKPTYR